MAGQHAGDRSCIWYVSHCWPRGGVERSERAHFFSEQQESKTEASRPGTSVFTALLLTRKYVVWRYALVCERFTAEWLYQTGGRTLRTR